VEIETGKGLLVRIDWQGGPFTADIHTVECEPESLKGSAVENETGYLETAIIVEKEIPSGEDMSWIGWGECRNNHLEVPGGRKRDIKVGQDCIDAASCAVGTAVTVVEAGARDAAIVGERVHECIVAFMFIVEHGSAEHAAPVHALGVVAGEVGGGRTFGETSRHVAFVVLVVCLEASYTNVDIYRCRLVDCAGMVVVDCVVVMQRGLDKGIADGRVARAVEPYRKGAAVHVRCCL